MSTAQNTLIHTVAFSDFNPSAIHENYLGDVGVTDTAFSFQFFVPGNSEFYVVGQQILGISTAENGEGCVFSVTVRDSSTTCP